MLKKNFKFITLLLLTVACSSVPITGRKQMNLMPESNLIGMAVTNYTDVLSSSNVVGDYDEDARRVKEVGNKIAAAAEKFLEKEGQSNRVDGFEWEFNLIDEPTVNAWCMPGGKVAFYKGIMPICKNDDGLAVVMGHEVAHAIARHGNERMSQQLLVAAGGVTLAVAMHDKPALTQDLFLLSYGVGTSLGVLAYSRSHESEADKMGLVFMEYAGYNSEEAVAFWERMSAQGGGGQPELLSTHPSDEKRIAELREYLPVAKAYAKKHQ
tara:strand:+ start:901 stop:1701 length:801 start_codon:yes stop_codon:yes gene_type:complete